VRAVRPPPARPARERPPVRAHAVEVNRTERSSGQGDEDARVSPYRVGHALPADQPRADKVVRSALYTREQGSQREARRFPHGTRM